MEWISVKDRMPTISYLESDNIDDPYEAFPVLVFSPEKPGIMCVAILEKNQDESSWNFEDLFWSIYIPGKNCQTTDVNFEEFTHWMPMPNTPEEINN